MMKWRKWLKLAWYKLRGKHTMIIPVKNQEDIEPILNFFNIPDEILTRVMKMTDPSYGRLITFEFDLSDPDGNETFECIKKLCNLKYGDIKMKIGDHYLTFECQTSDEADEIRKIWKESVKE